MENGLKREGFPNYPKKLLYKSCIEKEHFTPPQDVKIDDAKYSVSAISVEKCIHKILKFFKSLIVESVQVTQLPLL